MAEQSVEFVVVVVRRAALAGCCGGPGRVASCWEGICVWIWRVAATRIGMSRTGRGEEAVAADGRLKLNRYRGV